MPGELLGSQLSLAAARVVGASSSFGVGAKPHVQLGSPQQNRLHLNTLPTAADRLSIEGTGAVVVTFEFRADTPPTGGTAGRVWVYDGGAAGPSRVNLVDAINGVVDAARINYNGLAPLVGFTATDFIAQTSVLITEVTPSETTRAVTENLTAAADIWDEAANTAGGMLETRQRLSWKRLTIQAAQRTAGEAFFAFNFAPTVALIWNQARPQDESWIIAGNTVRLTLSAGASPNNQAGDPVVCLVIG